VPITKKDVTLRGSRKKGARSFSTLRPSRSRPELMETVQTTELIWSTKPHTPAHGRHVKYKDLRSGYGRGKGALEIDVKSWRLGVELAMGNCPEKLAGCLESSPGT
jgi:hypothetical protein